MFYSLRICSIEKFLYQPGLTATAGFIGGGGGGGGLVCSAL